MIRKPNPAHTDAASEHQAHVERLEVEANARAFREREDLKIWLAERDRNIASDQAFQRDCDRRLAEHIAWREARFQ